MNIISILQCTSTIYSIECWEMTVLPMKTMLVLIKNLSLSNYLGIHPKLLPSWSLNSSLIPDSVSFSSPSPIFMLNLILQIRSRPVCRFKQTVVLGIAPGVLGMLPSNVPEIVYQIQKCVSVSEKIIIDDFEILCNEKNKAEKKSRSQRQLVIILSWLASLHVCT